MDSELLSYVKDHVFEDKASTCNISLSQAAFSSCTKSHFFYQASLRKTKLGMVTRTKKIFVGGLSAPTTLEDVKNYFEQFGPNYKMFSSSQFHEHPIP
ncbi:hypothetical protein J437_LFUL007062 [Ladona fulva]|uniref:Uncharacterized protein n=1 Tax=Ladona fulva TaxID=123851 RepID=A0A8K0P0P6_LADFU|nr:hypothetical protein J437_LFUL007062 [Ladona fulva]